MFRDGRMPDFELSLWTRLKMRLFGVKVLGMDLAEDGSDTAVEGYWLRGKFYITKITHSS